MARKPANTDKEEACEAVPAARFPVGGAYFDDYDSAMCIQRTLLLALTISAGISTVYSQSVAEHAHTKAAPSTELRISVDGKTATVTQQELAAMPQKSVKVHNEHTKKDETYTGVLLSDLLAKYGFAVGPSSHRAMLHSYIKAEGTDKYWVLYSTAEIEGTEHQADVIVATRVDGRPLGDDGQLKLVDSADKKPQRWVRNLTAIQLVNVSEWRR